MNGLRQIVINCNDEFGLNVKIEIEKIFINIEQQIIQVSYYKIYSSNNIEIKRESLSYELRDYGVIKENDILDENGEIIEEGKILEDKNYLSKWDLYIGSIIEQGIRGWFS